MTADAAYIGKRHTHAERGHDLYETPIEAVRALLAVEDLPPYIWEPACGRGAIVRPLREAGHTVVATDLVDYQWPGQDMAGVDFLGETGMAGHNGAIVTNPPYKHADQFVRLALERSPKVVMLLRFAFCESHRRRDIIGPGLARIHLFRKRLPMMHRDGWQGRKANSGMPFAWFVWERGSTANPALMPVSWEEHCIP